MYIFLQSWCLCDPYHLYVSLTPKRVAVLSCESNRVCLRVQWAYYNVPPLCNKASYVFVSQRRRRMWCHWIGCIEYPLCSIAREVFRPIYDVPDLFLCYFGRHKVISSSCYPYWWQDTAFCLIILWMTEFLLCLINLQLTNVLSINLPFSNVDRIDIELTSISLV